MNAGHDKIIQRLIVVKLNKKYILLVRGEFYYKWARLLVVPTT